jgi:hypothetical protein
MRLLMVSPVFSAPAAAAGPRLRAIDARAAKARDVEVGERPVR